MEDTWNAVVFNPSIIDESKRVIQGVASAPVYDRQNELITSDAIKKAIDDFMVLPVLTVQHTQYVAGVVHKLWFDDQERLCIKAYIKGTPDLDRVWDLIKAGKLNAFSITGCRKSSTCNVLNKGAPCVTDELYINSITICGDNKVNQEAYFNIVEKSFTLTDVLDMVEEKETTSTAPSVNPETNNVSIAKAVVEELNTSGLLANIVKACMDEKDKKEDKPSDEKKEDEKKPPKDVEKAEPSVDYTKELDTIKADVASLASAIEGLKKSVDAIANNPIEKAQIVIDKDVISKAFVGDKKIASTYADASLKMRMG